MSKVLLVVGARPNYMKAASIIEAAPRHGLTVKLVDTGQHYDAELTRLITEDLGLPAPDHRLDVGRGRAGLAQLAAILTDLPAVVEAEDPDVVVVVGDVTSTLGGALVAAKARARPIALAHVEAGLRSRDRTMPEELNRLLTDQLADLLFCTEQSGVDNLLHEGRHDALVLLVGNTMIDTLLRVRARARQADALARLGLSPRRYGLVTLHRPSNVDAPDTLDALLDALGHVARRLPLVFPVHPRTRARLAGRPCPAGLRLLEPVGYLEFLQLTESAALVLTDSGGIQEETTVLGVPCLTLRESTERPVTVTAGTNVLVGTRPQAIVAAADRVLDGPTLGGHAPPLWDGKAGERIAAALAGWIAGGPTEARARAVALGARTV